MYNKYNVQNSTMWIWTIEGISTIKMEYRTFEKVLLITKNLISQMKPINVWNNSSGKYEF